MQLYLQRANMFEIPGNHPTLDGPKQLDGTEGVLEIHKGRLFVAEVQ